MVLTCGTGRRDAQAGFAFREVKPLGAVGEHRRRRLPRVEASAVDLPDVDHDVDLGVPGAGEEVGEPAEELVVGK
jgi:hypothetical protein